jgi:hypothetical protein
MGPPVIPGCGTVGRYVAKQRRSPVSRVLCSATGNDGFVRDESPPSGRPGFAPDEGTFSAMPPDWTHAQFVRLAWSIAAGRAVERPRAVACR